MFIKKSLLIMISVVAVIVFTVMVVSLAKPEEQTTQNQGLQNVSQVNPPATINPAAEVVKVDEPKIDTANWKIYQNKEYGFEFQYPRDWYIIEENNSYTGEKFIRVTNFQGLSFGKGDVPRSYLAINVTIYNNKSKAISEFQELKNKYGSIPKQEINFDAGADKKISLYIHMERSAKEDFTWDQILPGAEGFLEGENFSYFFHIATELSSLSEGQKQEVEILHKSLESFRLLEN